MENIMEYAGYVVIIAGGLLATTIAFLKIRAPKTETLKDDKALEILEKAERALDQIEEVLNKNKQ